MRQSIWPVSVFGLGLLLVIIGAAGVANLQQTREIYKQITNFEDSYRHTEDVLGNVRLETFRVALLLNFSFLSADPQRDLDRHRTVVRGLLAQLPDVRSGHLSSAFSRFETELNGYFDFVQEELASARNQNSAAIVRAAAIRRARVFAIADEISRLDARTFDSRRRSFDGAVDALEHDLWANMLTALFVGLCIAAGAVFRISELEQMSAQQQAITLQAEVRLRHLSQQLVSSQEQERKSLSRELHDEIGQSLTALRIELGKLQFLREAPEFTEHLEETKKLAEQTLKSARSISMGLRPAMLDELGLGPALEWQAREFSRRFSIPVHLAIASDLRDLPDQHRTYLYRIVQECLTNCARHSQATDIRVNVAVSNETIAAAICDNGTGFNPGKRKAGGLGLLGMSERVRELDGVIEINSAEGKGTEIRVRLPLLQPIAV